MNSLELPPANAKCRTTTLLAISTTVMALTAAMGATATLTGSHTALLTTIASALLTIGLTSATVPGLIALAIRQAQAKPHQTATK